MNFIELRDGLAELQTKIHKGVEVLDLSDKQSQMASLQQQSEDPKLWDDPQAAGQVSKQLSALEKLVTKWEHLRDTIDALHEMIELVEDNEDELVDIIGEFEMLAAQYAEAELDLLFDGEFDEGNALLEFSAGAGGTEAQDWCEMLLRMYLRFAERHEFQAEILNKSAGDEAGIKSAVVEIRGDRAYGLLKSEKGTHRLVRISPFNAQGKRQTSFAGVVVTPLLEDKQIDIVLEEKDLRVDTFRASGAGGQHVNKTDSAVRIVHEPSGITAESQSQRSQHQNREKALQILKAKLYALEKEEEAKKAASVRGEVTEAAWGTQIRNYVLHPYKMVKDLRTNTEKSNPDAVLDGEIDDFVRAYLEWGARGN